MPLGKKVQTKLSISGKCETPKLFVALKVVTQFTFTFSKSTIETLEKGVEHILNEKQANQNDVNDVVLVFLLLTTNIFHTFF